MLEQMGNGIQMRCATGCRAGTGRRREDERCLPRIDDRPEKYGLADPAFVAQAFLAACGVVQRLAQFLLYFRWPVGRNL